ncbi:tail fiber protein [Sphingopyxis sp. YF1]|jgi:microcystin-dependent protein|uniref:phage tail protein n=1 Tax=Sphingopyxis sp. YF1 TaxID=2482763 RepID=UPI001F625B78|nr:tail fiber protein [Sphingopyxis sp. YF1]
MTRKGAIRNLTIAALASASSLAVATPALAQTDRYLGQMIQVGFTFCPAGWASAEGQILAISQNTALFSLLGTTYGGNGQTTFALPDLRGRTAINQGSGPGLSPYVLGEFGGSETTTLLSTNLPRHDHRGAIQTANAAANTTSANGNALAYSANNSYLSGVDPNNAMDGTMVQVAPAGNSQPVSNRPPYLTMRWCIALQGIFPARN